MPCSSNKLKILTLMQATDSKLPEIDLAIIDRHSVLRDGLETLLDSAEGITVSSTFPSPVDAGEWLRDFRVDVLLTDIFFDGIDMLHCIADWAKEYAETRVLALSQYPEQVYAERVLNAGGAGYLMKDVASTELVRAVRQVHGGEIAVSPIMANRLLKNYSRWGNANCREELDLLSNREMLVLTLIGQGLANAKIAEQMGVSKKTVCTFKERIKQKLSLANSVELSQAAADYYKRII